MTGEPATFGTLLRRQRLAAGVTQEQLAELAGLSVRGIQDLERGARRVPHAETVRRLSSALEQLAGGPPASVLAHTAAESRLNAGRHPPPLSVPLSSFVGREKAVAEVTSRLDGIRLLTLTGSGGIGKTRLALAVAASLSKQRDVEVYFADLSAVVDGDLVVECLATALGLREQLVRPLIETVCDALVDLTALLVLDNCEHVLPACVSLVDTLMRRCPTLRILATSREPLRMSGEAVWRVPPLSADGAARLFVERAAAVGSDVEPNDRNAQSIADLCRRLEGVPLAIELAAARTSMFSIEQIVARLDDASRLLSHGSRTAPARHRTLRATIDWSYRQLTEPEQMLLERLSVFAGGCSFEALEAVASASWDVLELLGWLVDKSLVVAEPSVDGSLRYRLQEVLRQFSHERLVARGDLDAVRGQHARYFLQLLRDVETRALTVDRRAWLDRVELELDNCRAARRWFARHRDGKAAQRFESALYRTLMYRGHASEGRASLLAALALPGGSVNTRARVLGCLSGLAIIQADYALAIEYGEQSLTLRSQMDDPTGLAYAFIELGMTAAMRGDFVAAASRLDEARRASVRSGHGYLVAFSLAVSGHMEYLHGDYAAASQHAYAAIEVDGAAGFKSPTCMALTTLGNVSFLAGDNAAASRSLRAALAKSEDLAETYLIFRAALGLAVVAADEGDVVGARSLLDECLRRALQAGNRHQVAQALEGVANFAATHGHTDQAMRFAAVASAIRSAIGAPLSPSETQILTPHLRAPSGNLEAVAGAWELEDAAAQAQDYLNIDAAT